MEPKALKGRVLVSDIQRGERMWGKIILLNDDGTSNGVRDRWAQVFSVGEDITEIKAGEWILIKHGNWTRGMTVKTDDKEYTLWGVRYPEGVLCAADSPTETFAGEHVVQGEDAAKLKLNR